MRYKKRTGENAMPTDPHRSEHDPLQAARNESVALNTGWLKNGESMAPIQRVGYIIISLFFILSGTYTGAAFWEDFKSGDASSVLWGFATLFFIGLGVLGLRNSLRFSRTIR